MSVITKQRPPRESILTRHRSDERGLRTRQRRSGLLALSALLIVGSALAGGILFAQAGNTTQVLAVRDAVPKGHPVSRDNLISRSVSGVPDAIGSAAIDRVVGSYATVDLVPGQTLTKPLITARATPRRGEAVVGLSLSPGRVPSAGLNAGDVVDVIAVPASGNSENPDDMKAPATLANRALVYDVKGSPTQGGGLLVTVVVDESDASRIAAYSTAGRTALIETSAGGSS